MSAERADGRVVVDVPNGDSVPIASIPDEHERAAYIGQRATYLARAHHAAMGPAMRKHLNPAYMVLSWEAMPQPRRECMVDVMRSLIQQGVIE